MNTPPEPAPELLLQTRRFRIERIHHRLADGTLHVREVVRHPGAVTILPMVDDEHVCLIRNFRAAVNETLIELPAGTRDQPDEPAIETARRELLEETGFRAGHLELVHTFYMSPGILDEQMQVFVATDLVPGAAEREPGEEIDNLITPWADAMKMVDDGRIHDAKTLVGLLVYDRIRKRT